jgi:hypothetical protein
MQDSLHWTGCPITTVKEHLQPTIQTTIIGITAGVKGVILEEASSIGPN